MCALIRTGDRLCAIATEDKVFASQWFDGAWLHNEWLDFSFGSLKEAIPIFLSLNARVPVIQVNKLGVYQRRVIKVAVILGHEDSVKKLESACHEDAHAIEVKTPHRLTKT